MIGVRIVPKQIYNEGRVVGYSAYEMYLKHALSTDPNHKPASEKEWLASMMSMGSSMLLHVGIDKTNKEHYIDVQFPSTSKLCAANTIIASLFLGTGHTSISDTETGWVTKVSDYGILINNTTASSPNGVISTNGSIPPTNSSEVSLSKYKSVILEYLKIADGIVIQPGTWTKNTVSPPEKSFTPDLTKPPRLRLAISEAITQPFYLLLTGFTNRMVVDGVSGFSDSTNSKSPQDGDFLGPWEFPWSNKIIFTIPSAYMHLYVYQKYARSFPLSNQSVDVKSDPVIDMNSGDPSTFYESNYTSAKLPLKVTKINTVGDSASVLATYQVNKNIPPALYGAAISSTSGVDESCINADGTLSNLIVPLDTIVYEQDAGEFSELNVEYKENPSTGQLWKTDVYGVYNAILDKYGTNSMAAYLVYLNFMSYELDAKFNLFDWSSFHHAGESGYTSVQSCIAQFIQDYNAYKDLWKAPNNPFYKLDGSSASDVIKADVIEVNVTIPKAWASSKPATVYAYTSTQIPSITHNYYCPIDSVAPGNIKLYHGELDLSGVNPSKSQDSAQALESNAPGTTGLMRDSDDYIIYQTNEANAIVPIAKVDNINLLGVISVQELIGPYMVVEGTYQRSDATITKLSGYSESKSIWDQPDKWKVSYNGVTNTGTELVKDPKLKLQYNEPFLVIPKRITGKLSKKIQDLCGYEYDPKTKKLISGGRWDGANLSLIDQIPESERNDYYYLMLGQPTRSLNDVAWPIRKSDQNIDITMRYRMQIYITDPNTKTMTTWHIPSFYNDARNTRSSKYLGSWWGTGDPSIYSSGWAYIGIPGVSHPRLLDKLNTAGSGTGFVYNRDAMLPLDDLYQNISAKDIFGASIMTKSGILKEYQSLSLDEFFKTALVTDMGTGETLDPKRCYENICQPLVIYTNGSRYDEDTKSYVFDQPEIPACSLTINNTKANLGMTQIISIPDKYKSDNTTDAQGALITTGNRQQLVLSMADQNNNPYPIHGVSKTISMPVPGRLSWEYILRALSEDASLDIIGTQLMQLAVALQSCKSGTFQISKDSNGNITLTS